MMISGILKDDNNIEPLYTLAGKFPSVQAGGIFYGFDSNPEDTILTTKELQEGRTPAVEYVHVPDKNLLGSINAELAKGFTDTPVTRTEVESISSFIVQKLGDITDLTGLESFVSCHSMSLTGKSTDTALQITDLSPLIKLGEGTVLTSLHVIGLNPTATGYENVNQLKGKFPNLTAGHVATWSGEVLITLDELRYPQDRPPKIYGVKIDTANPSPDGALTYTDDAVGFTPAKGNNGQFNYGSWEDKFPFNQIKPCLLKDGVVQYYLNPNDYTKKIDGSSADITSGADGDVMVEFPKLYWKFETVGSELFIRYSDKKVDDGYKCLAHIRGSEEKDKFYLSAYLAKLENQKLRSLSGKLPTAVEAPWKFRTYAQANGSGYEQVGFYQITMLQVLYLLLYKNLNSQEVLGRGVTAKDTTNVNTGGSDSNSMHYGEQTGTKQNKFCGIEDFYGNKVYTVEGLKTDNDRNILIGTENFNEELNGYALYPSGITKDVLGWVTKIQGTTETGFIVKEVATADGGYYSSKSGLHANCYGYFGASADTPRTGGFTGVEGGAFSLVASHNGYGNYQVGARLLYM